MNKKYVNIVGTQIGIYEVLYKCQEKAKDGHDLFHVKCTVCGWETNMIPQHIGKAKVCKHIGTDGTYKNFSVKWKNETLQHIFAGIKKDVIILKIERIVGMALKELKSVTNGCKILNLLKNGH